MTTKPSRFLAFPLVLALAALMFTLPAKAEVISNSLESFSATIPIDCDNDGTPEDVVELSGDLHVLVTATTNDNVTTTKVQFVPRNITGTGLITGAAYRGVGLTTQTSTQVSDGPQVFTFVNNFYIIGQAGGYRYLTHETSHVTVDADGNVIVDHDSVFVTCPGS
jgi:hypothetical protein